MKIFFKKWLMAVGFLAGTVVAVGIPFSIGVLLKHHPIAEGVFVFLLFTGLFAFLETACDGTESLENNGAGPR
jgi:hypothetical protein